MELAPSTVRTSTLLPDSVVIREVGLRDSLQALRQGLPTAVKCDWILMAQACGVGEIEVGAFVSTRRYPELSDTPEVVAFARTVPGLRVSVVVHDQAGALAAMEAGVDVLTLPISANDLHSRANVRRSIPQMVEQLQRVRSHRNTASSGAHIEVVVSAAFGCALQGRVDAASVLALVQDIGQAGADGISLADSFGVATPWEVRDLFERSRAVLPAHLALGAHLHRSDAGHLGNVMAAVEAGVRRFDASLSGMGGSYVSPSAAGNVAIEDVVALFNTMGVATGIETRVLQQLRAFVGAQPSATALFRALAASRRRGGLFHPLETIAVPRVR